MMIELSFYEPGGRFITAFAVPDDESAALNAPEGGVEIAGMFHDGTFLDLDGVVKVIPPSPAAFMTWTGRAWEDVRASWKRQQDLQDARDAARLDKSDLVNRLMLDRILELEDAEIASMGIIPPVIQAYLDSLPPEIFGPEQQFMARNAWRNDTVISRNHPVMVLAAAALDISPEEMDVVFGVQIPL